MRYTCVSVSVLGDQVRAARRRHGLTQASLARRAGTTQAAISRIESGAESPSFERFETLLRVMGERAIVTTAPVESELSPAEVAYSRRLTPEQRLAESASWNLVATQLEIAAAALRQSPPGERPRPLTDSP
jgi:transcriptional regulator with XRE-family HTH domain